MRSQPWGVVPGGVAVRLSAIRSKLRVHISAVADAIDIVHIDISDKALELIEISFAFRSHSRHFNTAKVAVSSLHLIIELL